jgi:hypothetical protein
LCLFCRTPISQASRARKYCTRLCGERHRRRLAKERRERYLQRLDAGADGDIDVTDNNGCLLDMSAADGGGGGHYDGDGNLIPGLPDEASLPKFWWGEYVARPAYWTDRGLLRLPLAVLDASRGKFRLRVRRRDIAPGMYAAEASFFAPGRQLRLRERRWLEVEPTLRFLNSGPVTEQEVRLAMRDYACFNTFLQREESVPAEIAFAVRRPIDAWNETPPFVCPHTPATFPYRERWLRAAVGFLMQSQALSRLRNEMAISSDTVQMRDNANYDAYDRIGARAVAEYQEWVSAAKVAINVSQGFGSLLSPYGALAGGRRW